MGYQSKIRTESYLRSVSIETPSAGAYTSGDQVGGVFEIQNAVPEPGGSGVVHAANLIDKDKQSAKTDILLFSNRPVLNSVDNGACDLSDTELVHAGFTGLLQVADTEYFALANNSVGQDAPSNAAIKAAPGSKSIYGIAITRGTPTYSSQAALTLQVYVLPD